MNKKSIATAGVGAISVALLLAGCGTQTSNSNSSSNSVTKMPAGGAVATVSSLTGAGSTFDYPFFSRAFYSYGQANQLQVNYQSIGSGAGITQFQARTVDFGASDVPMAASDVSKAVASGGPIIQFPIALGGEAISYNLPGVKQTLKFTPAVLANIFLGKITNWDDSAIAKANPGVKLPNQPIVVVHRADGSGTTYIFTDYLSSVSPTWAKEVGKGKSVNWPVGIGGKGNEAVAGNIHNTVGAIGYVELAYALQTKMTYGMVENKAGHFESPTQATVKAAAATKPNVSATNFSIVNASGSNSYPIVGYSWVLMYQHPKTPGSAQALVKLFDWMEGPGQAQAASLGYVALPANVEKMAISELKLVK